MECINYGYTDPLGLQLTIVIINIQKQSLYILAKIIWT